MYTYMYTHTRARIYKMILYIYKLCTRFTRKFQLIRFSRSARPKGLYFESPLDIVRSPKLFTISYEYSQVSFYLSFSSSILIL